MAAYAALVSLAQTIHLIISNRHDSVSPQVIDQLTSIHKHAIFLQEFLQDFPDKSSSSMEARIKDVTHLAEDTIEFLLSDALLNHSTLRSKLKGIWQQIQSRYASIKSKLGSKSEQANDHNQIRRHDLKKAGKEIELVSEELMVIKNRTITAEDGLLGGGSSLATSSSTVAPIRKDAMVGFESELMKIKSRLCGEPSSPLEIIPIVGMGGIGKTTLALNTYDDPLIMERFQIRAWVTVSQDYSVQEIASGLLASMEAPELEAQRDSMKQHHVFKKL